MSYGTTLPAQLLSLGQGRRLSLQRGALCVSSDEQELLHRVPKEGSHFLDVSSGTCYHTK